MNPDRLPWRAGTGDDVGGIYAVDGTLVGVMLDGDDAELAVETVNGVMAALLLRIRERHGELPPRWEHAADAVYDHERDGL